MSASFLPYGRQVVDDDDIAAVVEALKSDYLTTGPRVAEFEKALAQILGVNEAVVCANGTAALHLAYAALGLGEGDAVVVPAITFLATANAARYTGAEVIFADVDPDTGLMTAETFEAAVATAKTPIEAVAPVHLAGQPCDMPAIASVAARYGIRMVEDACHALGTQFGGANHAQYAVGDCAFADAAVFSFHAVKTITMGEGGAITTNDPALAARMRQLRHHGMSQKNFAAPEYALDDQGNPNPWYAEMPELGYNYRATDFQCALGLSQIRKLSDFRKRRRALMRVYDEQLAGLAPIVTPVKRVMNADPCWHLCVVLIDFDKLGMDRAALMSELKLSGIGAQVHYFPVSHQPYYRRRYGAPELPGAWAYYQRCLSLPLYPSMTGDDVHRVCAALKDILRAHARAA